MKAQLFNKKKKKKSHLTGFVMQGHIWEIDILTKRTRVLNFLLKVFDYNLFFLSLSLSLGLRLGRVWTVM